jgi:AraC-like DNA-binding protein
MEVEHLLDPNALKVAGAAVKKFAPSMVAELLTHPMTATELMEEVISKTKMSESTFHRLFRELKSNRTVKKYGENQWQLS